MAAQQILGIVSKNPKEAIVHNIWIAILPQLKLWLEASGKHKQKIKLELIFKSEEMTTFSLLSEVSQHDEFKVGQFVEIDNINRRTGIEQQSLTQRILHAEKAIKPILLDAIASKRSPKHVSKVRIVIGTGVCRWVEKISGVEAVATED